MTKRTRPRRPDGRIDRQAGDPDDDPSRVFWLIGGALAIAAGTALGWDATALATVVTPPPVIRAALVGGSAALGVVLLLSALSRLAADEPVDPGVVRRPAGGDLDRPRGITEMIRGVRQVFLAVAAFAAASGWLIGHPLPLDRRPGDRRRRRPRDDLPPVRRLAPSAGLKAAETSPLGVPTSAHVTTGPRLARRR